jgi:hypothetical protein
MYIYTIVGAGGFGLGILLAPGMVGSLFGGPSPEPLVFGITGSVYLAFALLSILGLRSPLTFSPVLLLQLVYKSIWFIGVVLPMLLAGRFPAYGILPAVIYATYIVGDLIAIPFPYVFAGRTEPVRAGA